MHASCKESTSLTILKRLNKMTELIFIFFAQNLRSFTLFRNIIGTEVSVFPSEAVASLQEISIYMYRKNSLLFLYFQHILSFILQSFSSALKPLISQVKQLRKAGCN